MLSELNKASKRPQADNNLAADLNVSCYNVIYS